MRLEAILCRFKEFDLDAVDSLDTAGIEFTLSLTNNNITTTLITLACVLDRRLLRGKLDTIRWVPFESSKGLASYSYEEII